MNSKDLTTQHKQFVNEYFACGMNATQAYSKVYPNSSYNSSKNNGNRLLTKDDIQTEIQKRYNELQAQSNTTVIDITNKVKQVIEDCQRDDDRTNLLKALDLLAKLIGAYAPKRIEQTAPAPLQINIIKAEPPCKG